MVKFVSVSIKFSPCIKTYYTKDLGENQLILHSLVLEGTEDNDIIIFMKEKSDGGFVFLNSYIH